jgi:CRP-like cAMP-binding protein
LKNSENHLIEMLPHADGQRLLSACRTVDLSLSSVLCEPGAPAEYAYFPIDAFVSMLTATEGSPMLEVGMVGREGMVGLQAVLDAPNALFHGLVQGPGAAHRIPIGALREALSLSATLSLHLKRYAAVRMVQLGHAAGCLRFHQIGPRLARWLLMTQDRAHDARFFVTHAFLSSMLGVRRVGVTSAASALQNAGLIEYHRGALTVLDRVGLEAAACGCYAADRKAYSDAIDRHGDARPEP